MTALGVEGSLVLDTNVISEPLRPQPEPRVVEFLRDVSPRTFLTTVTLAELFLGAHLLENGRRKTTLLRNIDAVRQAFASRTLAFTSTAAEHYGSSIAGLRSVGRAMGVADAYIAAICVTNGAALVTRNTRDFEHYPELQLVSPWDEFAPE